MEKYKASIACALRNEALTLRESLQSLVDQTYQNKEIIIIDDESTDGSTEIAKEFARNYSFVKYYTIKHEPDFILKSRVTAIQKSTGDILFVVEADGKYDQHYLAACAKHLDKKGVGGVLGKIRVWKKKNTFISKCKDVHYRVMWDDIENMKKIIATGRIAPWIFYRKVYDDVGSYRKEAAWSADADFAKRMLDKGYKIVYEPNAAWSHRWREGLLEVIGYTLFWSRLDFGKKKPTKELMKMIYFFLFPPLVVASFFIPFLWWVVLLHILPPYSSSIQLYRKAAKMHIPGKRHALLSPVVSYITNISYAYGYLSNYAWRS